MDVDLSKFLEKLPSNAAEPVVSADFIPPLIQALGFHSTERCPGFKTDDGNCSVDFAARKNAPGGDVFLYTPQDPYLLIEVKAKSIDLTEGTPRHRATKKQLTKYLLSPKCKTAQWGIITNSTHIQLFRRHGKVVVPATTCTKIDPDNVNEVVRKIRHLIDNPPKALTICVYNNKGGVGKTTTVVNLAATLTRLGKRVLAVDLDFQQQDLTRSMGLSPGKVTLLDSLRKRTIDPRQIIQPFSVRAKTGDIATFDVIPADSSVTGKLTDSMDDGLKAGIQSGSGRLRDVLSAFVYDYDYILIDSPPNWMFFSQSAIHASDVVLIPAKHNNLFSLENAATAIKDFIPTIQKERQDGGPIALPIFFNGEHITPPQQKTARDELEKIILREQKNSKFDLRSYFFPKWTSSTLDSRIFVLPSYANVASAAFARVPAAYKNSIAASYYLALAKEYFIQ